MKGPRIINNESGLIASVPRWLKPGTLRTHLRKKHHTLRGDESGQVLLMSAIMALTLLAAALIPVPVGQTITAKIQAQNAADGAAVAAARWTARGSNIMQGLNGFMWDSDYDFIQAIIADAAYWIAIWAADCAEAADCLCVFCPTACYNCAWGDHKKGSEAINKVLKAEETFAKAVKAFEETAATAIPYLAYLHANQIAGEFGAGVINPADIAPSLVQRVPILGTLVNQLGSLIQQAAKLLGSAAPRCWTASFNLWPPSNHDFCTKKAPSSEWKSPLHTTKLVPFIEVMSPPLIMFDFKGWENDWYASKNVNKVVTYFVTMDPQQSFSLNSLFITDTNRAAGVTNLIGGISAFGSAKNYGDNLYESGISDPGYQAFPSEAFQWRPPPDVRMLGLFGWYYEGKFKTAVEPVEIMGVKGSTFLFFH